MMTKFRLHLTEEQYNELAQFWREFMMLGPTQEQKELDLTGLALDFREWIDADEDEPCYGLSEITAFFGEKERREGAPLLAEFTAPSVTDE